MGQGPGAFAAGALAPHMSSGYMDSTSFWRGTPAGESRAAAALLGVTSLRSRRQARAVTVRGTRAPVAAASVRNRRPGKQGTSLHLPRGPKARGGAETASLSTPVTVDQGWPTPGNYGVTVTVTVGIGVTVAVTVTLGSGYPYLRLWFSSLSRSASCFWVGSVLAAVSCHWLL